MITSTKNSRIVNIRKLSRRKHRRRQNRFLVEGLQLLGMAVEAMQTPTGSSKITPIELFYTEALFTGPTAPRLLEQLVQAGAEAIPISPHVMNAISERDTSQGLAATFALAEMAYPLDQVELSVAGEPPLLLVVDQLQDPGNLGTLIRTADAVGARAVILLEPCVDPFDPKTIRGTMGSIFTVPLVRLGQPGKLFNYLNQWGYRAIGADVARGSAPWQSDILAGPVALVLGSEAHGLNPALEPHLAGYVSLPIRGQAESLNVSIAGGVLMYEWLRVNSR